MACWITTRADSKERLFDQYAHKVKPYAYGECGTAGCIAGWTVVIGDKISAPSLACDVRYRAKELLGLEYCGNLFYPDRWDYPYREQYAAAQSVAGKGKVAARYIEHFIKTRGPQPKKKVKKAA